MEDYLKSKGVNCSGLSEGAICLEHVAVAYTEDEIIEACYQIIVVN